LLIRPVSRRRRSADFAGGLQIDAPDKDVTRRITEFRGDVVRTGWIGRQLPRLFKSAGLDNIEVEILPSPRTDYTHTNAWRCLWSSGTSRTVTREVVYHRLVVAGELFDQLAGTGAQLYHGFALRATRDAYGTAG
jgi:hypothetical protein